MPIMASVTVLLVTPKMDDVLSVASILAVALALVGALTLYGRVDLFVVGWVFFFPLGYYFLTFPRENSLFTLDRALTSLLLAAMFLGLAHKDEEHFLTKTMMKAAVAWVFFLLAAFVSLRTLANPLGAAKEAADVFLFW